MLVDTDSIVAYVVVLVMLCQENEQRVHCIYQNLANLTMQILWNNNNNKKKKNEWPEDT